MIEEVWERVRAETKGVGAIRIDSSSPGDFFGAQDAEGRIGLLLILDSPPRNLPRLEAVDITAGEREDKRWGLGIWLTSRLLTAPFAQLCDDLIDAGRAAPMDRVGEVVVSRLHRWQALLESAGSGMSLSKLRGLVGELLMLRQGLDAYQPAEVVRGWSGPFSAPQDFALPALWLEVKATFPTARVVRINSADQLAAPGRLVLVVCTLASLLPQDTGISAASLVLEIESRLKASNLGDLVDDLEKRLAAVGYQRDAEYSTQPFRLDAVHYFNVAEGFPRITPSDLAVGVAEVAYDLDLGALSPFEIPSPFQVDHEPG